MEGQLTSSVRWTDSVRWLAAHGVAEFVEIGPKNVLTGLIRRIEPEVKVNNIRTPEDIEACLGQLAVA
jgi:[acyl-carrier-protein] S-malonyltransferase